jgi:two-component system OmpR family response regulator
MANILVVDDEPVLLDLISTALRRDGHQVIAMTDPVAACESFDSGRIAVDLLVTDVTLRPISGFEIVSRLIKKGFTSPVLFMSGFPALSDALGGLDMRAVLEKPFTAQQLIAAVHNALGREKTMSPRVA